MVLCAKENSLWYVGSRCHAVWHVTVTCSPSLLQNDHTKNVAVKIFMENVEQLLETKSIRDILKESREPSHLLYAYHQIRQEVSFLSNLNHPNLTELCGVKTQPMCLLLELAPKKSLRAVLKEYREKGWALEPLSLKVTAKQVCTQGALWLDGCALRGPYGLMGVHSGGPYGLMGVHSGGPYGLMGMHSGGPMA